MMNEQKIEFPLSGGLSLLWGFYSDTEHLLVGKACGKCLFFPETRVGLQHLPGGAMGSHPSLSPPVLPLPLAKVAKQEPTSN